MARWAGSACSRARAAAAIGPSRSVTPATVKREVRRSARRAATRSGSTRGSVGVIEVERRASASGPHDGPPGPVRRSSASTSLMEPSPRSTVNWRSRTRRRRRRHGCAAGRQTVTVNGTARALDGTDPATTALDFLRAAGLTGAKEGCAEGECGACAVMVVRPDGPHGDAGADRSRWTAVNACLVPAAAARRPGGRHRRGLGSPDHLHPVQHELAVRGGSQCGYCTPGFVCSMAAEYYRADRAPLAAGGPARPRARPQRLRPARPERQPVPLHRLPPDPRRRVRPGQPRAGRRPAARAAAPAPAAAATRLEGRSGAFERADDLAHALRLLADHPDAVLVAGSTDWGVEVNLRGARAPVRHRHRPRARAAHAPRSATTSSRSARR